jgi:hypothetical protein
VNVLCVERVTEHGPHRQYTGMRLRLRLSFLNAPKGISTEPISRYAVCVRASSVSSPHARRALDLRISACHHPLLFADWRRHGSRVCALLLSLDRTEHGTYCRIDALAFFCFAAQDLLARCPAQPPEQPSRSPLVTVPVTATPCRSSKSQNGGNRQSRTAHQHAHRSLHALTGAARLP